MLDDLSLEKIISGIEEKFSKDAKQSIAIGYMTAKEATH